MASPDMGYREGPPPEHWGSQGWAHALPSPWSLASEWSMAHIVTLFQAARLKSFPRGTDPTLQQLEVKRGTRTDFLDPGETAEALV